MAFMETVLVARAQRQRAEPPIDSDQELLANGVAALAGGFSQCLPPAGGFSQSAVNQRAGARSQLAGVITAVLAVLVALFLGPVLDDLPRGDPRRDGDGRRARPGVAGGVRRACCAHRPRGVLGRRLPSPIVGLTAGLLLAVGVGVVLTLVLVLRAVSQSRVRPLYPRARRRLDHSPRRHDRRRGAARTTTSCSCTWTASLYTGNARPTQDADPGRRARTRPAAGR